MCSEFLVKQLISTLEKNCQFNKTSAFTSNSLPMLRSIVKALDYSALPTVEYEWAHSVYGTITELQREDWPTP